MPMILSTYEPQYQGCLYLCSPVPRMNPVPMFPSTYESRIYESCFYDTITYVTLY